MRDLQSLLSSQSDTASTSDMVHIPKGHTGFIFQGSLYTVLERRLNGFESNRVAGAAANHAQSSHSDAMPEEVVADVPLPKRHAMQYCGKVEANASVGVL